MLKCRTILATLRGGIALVHSVYRKFWPSLLLFFLLGAIDFSVLVTIPIYSSRIINALSVGDSSSFYTNIVMALSFSVGSLITAILIKRVVIAINENIGLAFRSKMLSKVFDARFSAIENQSVGDNISRITNDVGTFKGFFAGIFCQIIFDILSILTLFIILVRIDVVLTSLILAVSAISVLLAGRSQARVVELSKRVRELTAKVIQSLQGWLSRAPGVKMYSIEEIAVKKFDVDSTGIRNGVVGMGKQQSIIEAVNGFIFGIPGLIILGYGGYQVLHGSISIGFLFAFLAYTSYFLGPSKRLLNFISIDIPALSPVIDRIQEILNIEKDEKLPFGEQTLRVVELESITFKIGRRIALAPSLMLTPGDIIAIVGSNGSGKSTFGKVVAGLYTPESGEIKMNHSPASHSALFSVSFYLPQKPVLFEGSILENITLFDPTPDRAKVASLINDLQLFDWISGLPSGIDHPWSQELNHLASGGEFQKICLARALYSQKRILLLDEPETYLDSSIRSRMRSMLNTYCSDKMVLIVSHSQELCQLANKTVHCSVESGEFNLAMKDESTHAIAN